MDDDITNSVEGNPVTAELLAFMVDNMTADDVQAAAFDVGIDPGSLGGSLAGELARSLIFQVAQRGELALLDRALRDTYPVAYRQAFAGSIRDEATAADDDRGDIS